MSRVTQHENTRSNPYSSGTGSRVQRQPPYDERRARIDRRDLLNRPDVLADWDRVCIVDNTPSSRDSQRFHLRDSFAYSENDLKLLPSDPPVVIVPFMQLVNTIRQTILCDTGAMAIDRVTIYKSPSSVLYSHLEDLIRNHVRVFRDPERFEILPLACSELTQANHETYVLHVKCDAAGSYSVPTSEQRYEEAPPPHRPPTLPSSVHADRTLRAARARRINHVVRRPPIFAQPLTLPGKIARESYDVVTNLPFWDPAASRMNSWEDSMKPRASPTLLPPIVPLADVTSAHFTWDQGGSAPVSSDVQLCRLRAGEELKLSVTCTKGYGGGKNGMETRARFVPGTAALRHVFEVDLPGVESWTREERRACWRVCPNRVFDWKDVSISGKSDVSSSSSDSSTARVDKEHKDDGSGLQTADAFALLSETLSALTQSPLLAGTTEAVAANTQSVDTHTVAASRPVVQHVPDIESIADRLCVARSSACDGCGRCVYDIPSSRVAVRNLTEGKVLRRAVVIHDETNPALPADTSPMWHAEHPPDKRVHREVYLDIGTFTPKGGSLAYNAFSATPRLLLDRAMRILKRRSGASHEGRKPSQQQPMPRESDVRMDSSNADRGSMPGVEYESTHDPADPNHEFSESLAAFAALSRAPWATTTAP